MKRGGRALVFLLILIVVLVVAAFLLFRMGLFTPTSGEESVPTPPMVSVLAVGQPLKLNDEVKPEAVSTMMFPQEAYNEKMMTNSDDVIGKFAAYPLMQGLPFIEGMVTDRPGMNQPGSEAAKVIEPGLVAIALPLNWQSGVAFGLKDGDRVNVIATTMFVDVDSAFQSILPNNVGQVTDVGLQESISSLTLGVSGAGDGNPFGRVEYDPVLTKAIYLVPSEAQRPRLVSQQILQDVQILHVGYFALIEGQTAAAPAPEDQDEQQPTPEVKAPMVITLMVTPQDAVALTYLLYGGAKFTFTLRAPDDSSRTETEAATLQYILSQYAIPVPAKLPYAIQPRVDELKDPGSLIPTPAYEP